MKYILASGSPRRIELFKNITENFEVIPSNVDESLDNFFSKEEQKRLLEESPWEVSVAIASAKAEDVAKNHKNALVLGADTGVFLDGEMIGKPHFEDEAVTMLKKLSGRTHKVITGYCVIINGKKYVGYDETAVKFNVLSDELISEYIESGKYKGKAGAYGIQDGYPLVESIDGDYYNVMGFPTEKIRLLIDKVI